MKKTDYKKIPTLIQEDATLPNGETLLRNNRGFKLGDHVVIQELLDGVLGSIEKDIDLDSEWFGQIIISGKDKTLSCNNKLSGFFDFVEDLNSSIFKINPTIVIYGQWTANTQCINYDEPYKYRWFVFDIYDKDTGRYLEQKYVKEFCDEYCLDYANVLYDGKFAGWDLCRNYLDLSKYAEEQLGIVVKNQDRLNTVYKGVASDLKIIDPKFIF